jgi:tetratricopeptide (TPR) repeat protein
MLVANRCSSAATVRQATRHAWLALEIALGGKSVWKRITRGWTAAEGRVFRQQMDAFVDLLSLSGLHVEDPDSFQRFFDEWHAARPAALAAVEEGDGTPAVAAPQALQAITTALLSQQLPQVGRLLGLRAPWEAPLVQEILAFFLQRLQSEGTGNNHWRCLGKIAQLLDERVDDLEALLDKTDDSLLESPVWEKDEDAVEQLFQRGLSRFCRGDYPQAARHFTAALRLNPSDARLYAHRGDAYRHQGQCERAIADFGAALQLNARSPALLVSRASAYFQSGEFDCAVADCTAILEEWGGTAQTYRIRAVACAQLGSLDVALDDLSAAIRLEPEDEETYYQRGILYLQLERPAEAITDFSQVLTLNPRRVAAYEQRGDAYRRLKDYTQAIRDFGEVLRLHPSNVQAYANRASVHRLRGDLARALADYEQALILEPKNARVRCSLGILFRKMGDLQRAELQLSEALRLDSENWAALYHRGKICLQQGHCEEALAHLSAALARHDRLAVALLSRAILHDSLGHFQEALRDSAQAIVLDGTAPIAWLVRGMVQHHLGQLAESLGDLSEALRLDPRLASAYHERSLVFTVQADYPRALADSNQALALDGGNPLSYLHRSQVHRLLNETEKSLADYHRALQLDPHCLMSAWDRGQAERAQLRSAQRLAELIDGVKQPSSPAPAPAAVRIVLKSGPPERRQGSKQRNGAADSVPEEFLSVTPETVNDALAPTPTLDECEPAPPALDPSASDYAAWKSKQPISEDSTPELEDALSLLLDSEEATPSTPEIPAPPTPEPPAPVADVPAPRTFERLVWKPGKPTSKGKMTEVDSSTVLPYWKQPRWLAAAALLLLSLSVWALWPHSDHLTVYRARGQATLDGKPLANALIWLDPVWTKDPGFPRPHATSQADGSFVLETYGAEDGAPAGEYRVAVQLLVKKARANMDEDGTIPRNALPPQYARFETSELTVQIAAGENTLPALELSDHRSPAAKAIGQRWP